MITREFPPRESGGIGYYVYYLSKNLIRRGHEVHVITRSPTIHYTYEKIEGINLHHVPFLKIYPFHIFIHSFFVTKTIRKLKNTPTIIHLHSPLPTPIKTSIPIITTFHSPCKRAFEKKYRDVKDIQSIAEQLQTMVVYTPIEAKILKLSKKITTVSSNVSQELVAYGLKPETITAVGNGVDTEYFIPKTNANKMPYVMFVGVLRSGKGLPELIKCAKIICNKRPNIQFLICGFGPLLKSLQSEVHKAGLEKQVIFLGYVNRKQLLELYQKAAILLQPSAHEGLSTVILEAMSCGLPVIASDIPGNREVITSQVDGILISDRSPEAMANTVLTLLNDKNLMDRIGNNARNTIESKYSWEQITNNVEKCYKELLKSK